MSRRRHPAARVALAGVAALAALFGMTARPAPARAQDTTVTGVDSVIVTPAAGLDVVEGADTARPVMSARGAMFRSMAVPGWGQSAFGAYFRGGIYFAGWAGNWFMIFRTQTRFEEARQMYERRAEQIENGLIAAASDPDSMRAVLDTTNALETAIREDTTGNRLRKLVRARKQQREDWIALTIFWILASGVDGYVTAQLSDFPAAIDVEPNADRSLSIRVEVPFPRRRP